MIRDYLNSLIQSLKNSYYTGALLLVCLIIALIFAIKYYRKEKVNNFFIIYILYTFLLSDVVFQLFKFLFPLKGNDATFFLEVLNIVFAQIEFIVFSYFFKIIIENKYFKNAIPIVQIIFSILFFSLIIRIFFWEIEIKTLREFSYYFNAIEFFIFLPFCLFYFYELLTKQLASITYLTKSPSFWIITGLFFYVIVSLPFLIIGNSLFINNKILYSISGSIHYISFSFFLICLTKAFACKTSLTQ